MAGSKEDVFSIQEAVLNMLGDKAEYWEDQWDGKRIYRFEGLANLLEQSMLKDVQKIESSYLIVFMGFEFLNPFNHADIWEARFPRKAFFKWWVQNPNGLLCPSWLDDHRLEAEDICLNSGIVPEWQKGKWSENTMPDLDNMPSSLKEEIEPPLCDDVLINEGDIEIVEGLTVKDLRDMLYADSPFYTPRLLALLRTRKALIPKEVKDEKGFAELNTFEKKERACLKEAEKQLEHLGIVKPKENTPKTELNSIARVICGIKSGDHGGGRPSLSKKKP